MAFYVIFLQLMEKRHIQIFAGGLFHFPILMVSLMARMVKINFLAILTEPGKLTFPLVQKLKQYKWICTVGQKSVTPLQLLTYMLLHQEKGFYFHLPNSDSRLLNLSQKFANDLKGAAPRSLRGNKNYICNKKDKHTSSQEGVNASNFAINAFECMAATLEISYQGPSNDKFYSVEDYQMIGHTLGKVLYEYSKVYE